MFKLPIDKRLHLLAGIAVAAMALPFGIVPAVLAPILIGLFKEILDPYVGGTRDIFDFLATAAGGLLFIVWIKVVAVYA